MSTASTSGANDAGHETRVHGEDEHTAVNDVNELLRIVRRKVTVRVVAGSLPRWLSQHDAARYGCRFSRHSLGKPLWSPYWVMS
jgi:hypothetical protein